MKKHKLICIAGHCGSGKTTAIEIMAQHLSNSAIVRGDLFLKDALLNHAKDFENIYKILLDKEQPFQSFMRVSVDTSDIKKYLQMFNAFIPFIESEIEKAVAEYKKQDIEFVLVEHITLPNMKIWQQADYRVMITSNRELRIKKLRERLTANHGENEEKFTLLSESALAVFSENANKIDFIIENRYNEFFENDLICLCQNIS